MSKSLVASVQTGILLAIAILGILGFVESLLQDAALRGAADRIYVSWVGWAPDGNVRYYGRQLSKGGGYVQWHYVESLTTPVRSANEDNEFWSMLPSAKLMPIRPEDEDLLAGKLLLLATDEWREESDVRRMLWWNGFAGQLEEYDALSARRLALLGCGREGAPAPTKPAGQPRTTLVVEGGFYPSVSRDAFLVTNGRIHRVSLPLKEMDTIFTAPGGQTITGIGLATSFEHQPTFREVVACLFVRYGDTFCRIDQTGKLRTCFVLPEGARTGTMTVCLLKDDKFGFQVWPSWRDKWMQNPSVSLLVDSNGSVLRRVDVDIQAINRKLHGRSAPPTRLAAPSLLPPIPVLMTTPALVQTTLVMLLAVILVVWHQKRTGQTGWRLILWPGFVAATSLFGFACYWVAHRDDVAEPCPGCRRKRPVHLVNCPHCGAAWPRWEPLGIEILEGIGSPGNA